MTINVAKQKDYIKNDHTCKCGKTYRLYRKITFKCGKMYRLHVYRKMTINVAKHKDCIEK